MTTPASTIENTPRLDYIKHLWTHEFTALWLLPGILMGLCAGFALGWLVQGGISSPELRALIESFLPEALGIGLTVTILYYFDQWRSDKREEKRLKDELLWQIHSRSNDVAITALDRLRVKGWFSLLKGRNFEFVKWAEADLHECDMVAAHLIFADFHAANIENTNLYGANLSGANLSNVRAVSVNLGAASLLNVNLSEAQLTDADLSNANLGQANLTNAQLESANLKKAGLWRANLTGADLLTADLNEANLSEANLTGASLLNADLENAKLENATFDEHTILPDGMRWIPDTDMTRFTNPQHPEFWRSDDELSPAYGWERY